MFANDLGFGGARDNANGERYRTVVFSKVDQCVGCYALAYVWASAFVGCCIAVIMSTQASLTQWIAGGR